MLHVIDNFPLGPSALAGASSGDTVLLVANAVYAVKEGTYCLGLLKQAASRLNLCVLGRDLEARGMAANEMMQGVAVIDERDYADLAEDSVAVRSWN